MAKGLTRSITEPITRPITYPITHFEGVGGRAPYLGPVATRTRVPDSFNTTNKQCMSRNYFRLTEDVTSLQLVYPNWHLATGAETAGGGATIAASILPEALTVARR